MMRRLAAATAMCLLLAPMAARAAEEDAADFDTGMIHAPHILLPDGDVSTAVVLISDAGGWSENEKAQADTLAAAGAIVIGIDLPSYLASLGKDDGDCVYMVSDIEALSQQVQRKAGNGDYEHPIVAGIGDGGALALAIVAQSPAATIGETVAVDPTQGIPLARQLCTPAAKQTIGDRMVYGLTDGPLPDPVTVAFTPNAPPEGKSHVLSIRTSHPDLDTSDVTDDAETAFGKLLAERIAAISSSASPLDLPIEILPTEPTLNTMAIIYSGDGGWRDIDKDVGGALQAKGIPVVGIDSLRYFWSKREPQETADDLAKIIAFYRNTWNVEHVLLIGYSFGADILPATYNLLGAEDRARVPQITLMALSHQVDYEVSVMGWLGATGAAGSGDPIEDLKTVDPGMVQCIYGTDEDDDACPDLRMRGVEGIAIDGGHHFDGDYRALADRIIDGLTRRLPH